MFSPRSRVQLGLFAAGLVLISSLVVLARSGKDAWRPRLLKVGAAAPDFTLSDIDGHSLSTTSLRGKATVLFFGSTRGLQSNLYNSRIMSLAERYAGDGRVQFVAVNRRDVGLGEENLCEVRVQARAMGRSFPTVIDADNRISRLYGAMEGPTFYVIDADGTIRYRGPFDDNADASQVKRQFCREALESILNDPSVTLASTQVPLTGSRRP